jgi:hypothetical protein
MALRPTKACSDDFLSVSRLAIAKLRFLRISHAKTIIDRATTSQGGLLFV